MWTAVCGLYYVNLVVLQQCHFAARHRLTQTYTQIHTDLHGLTRKTRLTRTYTDCTENTDLHRLTRTYTDLHRDLHGLVHEQYWLHQLLHTTSGHSIITHHIFTQMITFYLDNSTVQTSALQNSAVSFFTTGSGIQNMVMSSVMQPRGARAALSADEPLILTL